MTTRPTGQNWALDIALAQGGFDALHPKASGPGLRGRPDLRPAPPAGR